VFPGGVCNAYDVANHDGWKVDLLRPVYQINEALVHRICYVASLTPGNDILDHKPKDQLMERRHILFLYTLGCLQACLLTQFLRELQ